MGMDQPPTPPAGGSGAPDWGDMKNKVAAAQGPDRMLLIAGLVFLVSTFLPWYRVTVRGFGSASDNAWGLGGLGVLAALFGVAAFGVAVAGLSGAVKVPSAALLSLGIAGGTLLFTLLRFLFKPGGDAAASISILTAGAIKITRGIGLWIGLVVAIVMTAAAYQKYKAASA